MRLLKRLIAILTVVSFAGSGTLSAMPLVWCIGNDGHRAVEAMLHQGTQAAEPSVDYRISDKTHQDPCSDWQLLSPAGSPQAKTLDAEPKVLTVLVAYPPLKLAVGGSSSPARALYACHSQPPTHLAALHSVVLRI